MNSVDCGQKFESFRVLAHDFSLEVSENTGLDQFGGKKE